MNTEMQRDVTRPQRSASMLFDVYPLEWLSKKNCEGLSVLHTQQEFEIIWIQEGSGIHTINGESYDLLNNTIYAALPGQKHQLIIYPGAKGYIIRFNSSCQLQANEKDDLIQNASFYHFHSLNAGLFLEDDKAGDVEEVFARLLNEVSRYSSPRIEIVCKYLEILMIYLKGQIELPQTKLPWDRNNILLNNFLRLLENNFLQKKAVSAYAKELFVTPNYLNTIVKKRSGYSASHHIKQRVVLEAKRKAQQTGANMKEVANYLGFDNIPHFSKFFKTTTGVNFSTFKKGLAGNYTLNG